MRPRAAVSGNGMAAGRAELRPAPHAALTATGARRASPGPGSIDPLISSVVFFLLFTHRLQVMTLCAFCY